MRVSSSSPRSIFNIPPAPSEASSEKKSSSKLDRVQVSNSDFVSEIVVSVEELS